MSVRALFTTSALLLQLLLAATSAADQSTCRGIWLFELPCTEPISALVNQVNDWSSDKCQDSQEKCMYEGSFDGESIIVPGHNRPPQDPPWRIGRREIGERNGQVAAVQNMRAKEKERVRRVTKESSTYLEIKHTSPRSHKISLISFEFNPPAAPTFCKMRVVSTTTSQNVVTPNDYCLIYNLINGSGLTKAQGYREICNKQMCPSKQWATCYTEE